MTLIQAMKGRMGMIRILALAVILVCRVWLYGGFDTGDKRYYSQDWIVAP